MECTELSPAGNFEAWEPNRLEELQSGQISSEAGQLLLHESDETRLWLVSLEYKQRLGFRNTKYQIKTMSQTDGFAVSHYGNGQICLIEFKKDQMQRQEVLGLCDKVWDLENIGSEPLEFILIEYLMSECVLSY